MFVRQKGLRNATYLHMEEATFNWFDNVKSANIPISGPVLLAKAKPFAFLFGHSSSQPGNGWLHRFKECHRIKFFKVIGEAGSIDDASIEE